MSTLFLLRHGQAGSRDDYDRLSDLGHRQTAQLGAYLAREPQFVKAFAGALRRQQESARNVLAALPDAPDLITDPRWNEFDLDLVYREIGPQLAADDPRFRELYDAALAAWNNAADPLHRHNSPADALVVRAWIENRYPYSGESWQAFTARVHAALDDLVGIEGPTLIFTSATPTAISISHALSAPPLQTLLLAGSLYNASINRLRRQHGHWSLFTCNETAHLRRPEQLTFR